MPSVNRKREWEGGQDGARPNKKTSIGASTSASSSDPDTLISPYDGHRRYDEWKGMMYGFPKVISGSGAMYPTNYKIDFCTPNPWICPLVNCRKSFQQPAQLGAHFSQAHRKLLLYDEVRSGLFWVIGERKNPDKDGRFRSIVVKRGYYAPDDVRQPPEDWESYVNPTAVKDINPPNLPQPAAAPAARSSTTHAIASASRPSAAPAVSTPRPLPAPAASATAPPAVRRTAPGAGLVGRPTGNSVHEVIDIRSDEEDVKPSLAELQRASSSTTSGPQRAEAQRAAQRLGGNEADTQKDPFQNNPFLFDDPVEPVHDRNGSTQAPVNRQPLEPVQRAVDERCNPETSPIWTYMIKYAREPTPLPDDAAIAELLTELPRRRDLPEDWKGRLAAFDTLSINQLSALILYLGGTTPTTDTFQYCKGAPMKCHLRKGATGCSDPTHNGGRCWTCGFNFPQCVFLPGYLLSSVAVAERFGIWLCCNSFYRNMPVFPVGVPRRYTHVRMGRREENGNSNTMPKEKANNATSPKQRARPHPQTSASRSHQSIAPLISSTSASFSNFAIQNKPDTPITNNTSNGVTSTKEKAKTANEGASSATKAQDNRDHLMDNDDSDPFDFDPFDFEPGHMPSPQNGTIQRQSDAQLASSNSSAANKKPLPESSSVWDYIMSFSKTQIPIPNDEAITELLALRRLRELPKSWKYWLGAFDQLDLKSYTAVILYLTGEEAHTSPCSVMGCKKDDWNRVNVKFAFPQCVSLPRYLLSSKALSKRLGIKTCCNAYYRIDKTGDNASKEQVMAALGHTGIDGTANNRASSNPASKMTANSGSNHAKPNNSIPKRSPFVSSAATFHTKPHTTPQQRNNKASSQKSSGTFCLPEDTPGQLFSLKGTDTKLIQSSRNQILKCKVLAGDGIKVQLIGGKAFRAYKGWNDEWDIPPDSQCLVENICPKKSFGEDQTCIDVNPKKGVLKAGQAQGMMVKGKMI